MLVVQTTTSPVAVVTAVSVPATITLTPVTLPKLAVVTTSNPLTFKVPPMNTSPLIPTPPSTTNAPVTVLTDCIVL